MFEEKDRYLGNGLDLKENGFLIFNDICIKVVIAAYIKKNCNCFNISKYCNILRIEYLTFEYNNNRKIYVRMHPERLKERSNMNNISIGTYSFDNDQSICLIQQRLLFFSSFFCVSIRGLFLAHLSSYTT